MPCSASAGRILGSTQSGIGAVSPPGRDQGMVDDAARERRLLEQPARTTSTSAGAYVRIMASPVGIEQMLDIVALRHPETQVPGIVVVVRASLCGTPPGLTR